MQKNNRPDDREQPLKAPDGPLTELVEREAGQHGPDEHGSRLPQPNPAKQTGAEDYASGTPEHEDDRET